MSKPLTINELKALEVGDWVWLTDNHSQCGHYAEIGDCIVGGKNRLFLVDNTYNENYYYSYYGTKWLAYKNKEQAEAKGEIVEFGIPFFSKHFDAWCVFEKVEDYIQTVCITESEADRRLAELTKE